jgi:K+-transporting ATPase ATPase C chain
MTRTHVGYNGVAQQETAPPRTSFGAEILHHLRVAIVATIVLAAIVCGIYPLIVWGLAQTLFPHQANGSLVRRDGTPTNNDAEAVGSALLGQPFSDAKYFHPRPSAAGSGYDPTASGGSNLGPLSAKLFNGTTKPSTPPAEAGAAAPAAQPATQPAVVVDYDGIKLRTLLYAQENNIDIVDASQPLKSFQDDKGNYDQGKLIMAFNDNDHPLTFRTAVPIPADAVTASASGLDPHISVVNAQIQARRVADARKLPLDRVQSLIAQNIEGPDLSILGESRVNVLRLNITLDNLR